MEKGFTIAIDGPVAAGKGTIARLLSRNLPQGYYLYTGAMYRSIALQCLNENIDLNNEKQVINILPKIIINLYNEKVFLNGNDVTERIKKEDVAKGSSIVGTYKKVREYSVRQQQKIAGKEISKGKIVIAEGRDIGTRVLPNATIKIFLIADPLERAKRRKKQEHLTENLDTVLKIVQERDKRDTERKIDPLISHPKKYGYFIVNSTNLSIKKTLGIIMDELKKKGLIKGAHSSVG